MNELLSCYGSLLQEVDEWFARAATASGAAVSCRTGCSACCRGLFDITLLDACYLKTGFDKLDTMIRKTVLARAEDRLSSLQGLWPDFTQPFILNYRPEEDWEDLMPEEDETPCVLLGPDGRCLVYEHRPMTCRLNGIPLVDTSGEVFFEEWCSLNFIGQDPLSENNLRWGFRSHFRAELELFHMFTERMLGCPVNELDTFIPTALLIDFERFDWGGWWKRAGLNRLVTGRDLHAVPDESSPFP
jgi:Fe-S-cluster containining protein